MGITQTLLGIPKSYTIKTNWTKLVLITSIKNYR